MGPKSLLPTMSCRAAPPGRSLAVATGMKALLLGVVCGTLLLASTASIASTLRFCNLRPVLSTGQAEYVAGIALLGDQIDRYLVYRGADDATFDVMKTCAREVR